MRSVDNRSLEEFTQSGGFNSQSAFNLSVFISKFLLVMFSESSYTSQNQLHSSCLPGHWQGFFIIKKNLIVLSIDSKFCSSFIFIFCHQHQRLQHQKPLLCRKHRLSTWQRRGTRKSDKELGIQQIWHGDECWKKSAHNGQWERAFTHVEHQWQGTQNI